MNDDFYWLTQFLEGVLSRWNDLRTIKVTSYNNYILTARNDVFWLSYDWYLLQPNFEFEICCMYTLANP